MLYLRACNPGEVVHSDVSPENKGAEIMDDGSAEFIDNTEHFYDLRERDGIYSSCETGYGSGGLITARGCKEKNV